MNLEVVAAAQLIDLQQGLPFTEAVANDDLDFSVSTSDVLEQLDDCPEAEFINELNAEVGDSLSSLFPTTESSSFIPETTGTKRMAPSFSPVPQAKKSKAGLYLSQEDQQRLMNEPIESDDVIHTADGCPEQCSAILVESALPVATIPIAQEFEIPSVVTNESSGEPRVGVDSWQMNVMHRMMEKLSPEPKKVLQDIVTQAIDRHNEGDIKYKHLPGSIFEDAMTHMDTDLFLETYIAVRNDMNHHPSDSVKLIKKKKTSVSNRWNEVSDIQLAMGYSFVLGMKHGRATGTKLNSLKSIEELLREAREKVSNLEPSQRMDAWLQIVEFTKTSKDWS